MKKAYKFLLRLSNDKEHKEVKRIGNVNVILCYWAHLCNIDELKEICEEDTESVKEIRSSDLKVHLVNSS